jgi:UDP-glucose 4-epimerase
VTGGAGFAGSLVLDALRARGDEVAVLDDLSTRRREHVPSDVELVEADLAAPAATAFVGAWRPDAVAHLAARASVRESVEDPVRDAAAFARATGWRPRVALGDGLRLVVDALRS